MMHTNTKLAGLAAILLVGSVWAYGNSTSRGDRFQRGQLLLPNLMLDEVAAISISQGDETTTLQKGEDQFTVSEAHDYPARNETVNRLLRDLMQVELEKEVGRGDDLAAELALDPPTDETIELALTDSTDQEMVRLRIGASVPEGTGRYVRRVDLEEAPIYLTAADVFLSTAPDAYLQKEIVDHSQADVQRVLGSGFEIARENPDDPDSALQLRNIPAGSSERVVNVNKLKSILSRLSFEDVFLADDPDVRGLQFENALQVDLTDGTSYWLQLAVDGERRFLRIAATHGLERVEIAMDTPEEELREKADQLSRAEEVQAFDTFHRSWVYEISTFTADTLALNRADLLDDDA